MTAQTAALATDRQIAYATQLAAAFRSDIFRRRAGSWPAMTVAQMSEEIDVMQRTLEDHRAWGIEPTSAQRRPRSAEEIADLGETWG